MNSLIAYVYIFFCTTAHRVEMTLFKFCSALYMCSWGMFACFILAVSSNSSQFCLPAEKSLGSSWEALGCREKEGYGGKGGQRRYLEWGMGSSLQILSFLKSRGWNDDGAKQGRGGLGACLFTPICDRYKCRSCPSGSLFIIKYSRAVGLSK